MGYCTFQSHRVKPSCRSVLPWNRPFETSTRSLGASTLMSIDSTSSRHWSLFGHHTLAPSSSHAVFTSGLPIGSLRKTKPPNRPISRSEEHTSELQSPMYL